MIKIDITWQWIFGISSLSGIFLSIAVLIITQTTRRYIRDSRLKEKLEKEASSLIQDLIKYTDDVNSHDTELNVVKGLIIRAITSVNHFNKLLSIKHRYHNRRIIHYCKIIEFDKKNVKRLSDHLNQTVGLYNSILHEKSDAENSLWKGDKNEDR